MLTRAVCAIVQAIQGAASPEEAARLGRGAQRTQPHLVRPDWDSAKLEVMHAALLAKFRQHDAPRAMLLATAAGKRGPLQVWLLFSAILSCSAPRSFRMQPITLASGNSPCTPQLLQI